MTRLMYDSTNAHDIPLAAAMVAGYIDHPLYTWTAADWARFPHAVKVRIATRASTNDGHVLDCETGDATPAQCPAWVRMRRAAGADPSVYMNFSTWPAVRAAFRAANVPEPHYWVAGYANPPDHSIPAGSVAHQYIDPPGSGGHYDLSTVVDFWPGVDTQGADMTPTESTQLNQIWVALFEGVPPGAPNNLDYVKTETNLNLPPRLAAIEATLAQILAVVTADSGGTPTAHLHGLTGNTGPPVP